MTSPAVNVITTGSPEMDKKMGGGIPVGSLVLVEGDSDSGKSVLTQQLTWGALQEGHKVTLYTTENTTRSLLRQMDSIGLDVHGELISGDFRIFPLSAGAHHESAIELLPVHMATEKAGLVIVDAATTFVQGRGDEAALEFFAACKRQCKGGTTVIVVMHSHAVSDGAMVRLRSMCDAHLRLRLEEVGDKLVKMLEVAKVRGAGKATGNIISFNVEPGLGMRIIPVSKAKA